MLLTKAKEWLKNIRVQEFGMLEVVKKEKKKCNHLIGGGKKKKVKIGDLFF